MAPYIRLYGEHEMKAFALFDNPLRSETPCSLSDPMQLDLMDGK